MNADIGPLLAGLLASLALALPAAARADTNYPQLDQLASYWAQRPVHVDCPTSEDWLSDPWAEGSWGYTLLWSDSTRIDPTLCDAALELANGQVTEPWRDAMAVLVIDHEAHHLLDWPWNWNEARVECAAISTWPQAFLMLTHWRFDGATLWRLASFALAEHYQITSQFRAYYWDRCRIPWWPPWRTG